jgi:hypothetical protein
MAMFIGALTGNCIVKTALLLNGQMAVVFGI